jgi:signal transduction histidine kinase/CHASE3 domain sensor protein
MQSRLVARLTAPVIAVSAVLILVALAAAWYVRDSQRTLSTVIASNVTSVQAAQELEISFREIHVQFDRYLITLDRKHLESVPVLRRRTSEALAEAEAAAGSPQEQALMKRVRQGHEHFFAEYDRLSRNPPASGLYASVLQLIDTVLTKEILEPTREYLRLNEGVLAQTAEDNKQLSERLTFGVIGLGVCGAAGGLLAGWVIANSLRRSLLKTDEVLRDTAALLDAAAQVRLVPIPGDGAPDGTLQRITEAAAAVLQRLKQTERDALRAEQLAWVGQMAAGIAHEVRNPLTSIKLLVQAATDPRRSAGFRPRDLQVLEGEILRLEQIISTFLDFARPPRPDKKSVAVSELLTECLAGVRARAELQNVEVHLDVADSIPRVDADSGQLRQVIYNLMFNALDVLPNGGTIHVRVASEAATDGRPSMVLVNVEDSGPGLPPGLESQIFDPFVSTKDAGLGLGLSISRRIVETHGGSIEARNGPAGGSSFTVRIPVSYRGVLGARNGSLHSSRN